MKNWKDLRTELLKDPEVKKEYNLLKPEYEIIRKIIDLRLQKKLTQEQLAQKIGTKQTVISRLESGRANPSLAFLKKVAQALGTSLELKFNPL